MNEKELLRQHLQTIRRVRDCWIRIPAYFSQELSYKEAFIRDRMRELGVEINAPDFNVNKIFSE